MAEKELTKLLELLAESASAEWTDESKQKDRSNELRKLLTVFQKHYDFKPGDIVRWKPSMKNRKRPAYGEPAVVVNVLSDPIHESKEDAGSPYYHEPLTLVLGVIDSDGDLLLFHYDSRRFEPFV